MAFNFHPIFIPLNQLFEAILDLGFWPPASPSCRLYETEAGGAIGAYAPEGLRIGCIALLYHVLLN
jgi:hypothetical protein